MLFRALRVQAAARREGKGREAMGSRHVLDDSGLAGQGRTNLEVLGDGEY